jgi:ADP-heptose:LPS heptosyltransferase
LAALGYQVVLTGSPEDADLLHAVANDMESKPIQMVEPGDMGVSAALLSQACLLVSNDVHMANLAAAVKTPSIVLASEAEPGRLTAANVLIRAIKHLEQVQQYA